MAAKTFCICASDGYLLNQISTVIATKMGGDPLKEGQLLLISVSSRQANRKLATTRSVLS